MEFAKTDLEIMNCYEVLKELRPNMAESEFLTTIRQMEPQGYELVFLREGSSVVAVAGFRICINLAAEGKALYVYDLVTSHSHRSKGFGQQMISDLESYAKQTGCKVLHLDSGVQRFRAHKFYLRNDFEILAHHFSKRLDVGV